MVSNPAFSRDAVTPRETVGVLAANTAAKDHVFWTDGYPFAEAVAFAGARGGRPLQRGRKQGFFVNGRHGIGWGGTPKTR